LSGCFVVVTQARDEFALGHGAPCPYPERYSSFASAINSENAIALAQSWGGTRLFALTVLRKTEAFGLTLALGKPLQ